MPNNPLDEAMLAAAAVPESKHKRRRPFNYLDTHSRLVRSHKLEVSLLLTPTTRTSSSTTLVEGVGTRSITGCCDDEAR